MISHLAMTGLAAICCVSAAVAEPKSRAKPASGAKSASLVSLENKRPVSLLTFEVIMPGAEKPEKEHIVAKLDEPLAAGRSVKLRLGKSNGCVFDVRWKFEDAGDVGSVDLCKDAHIVLTD
jgi:hypothetical protein